MAIKIRKPVGNPTGGNNNGGGAIWIIMGGFVLISLIVGAVESIGEYFSYGRGDWLIRGIIVSVIFIMKLVVTFFLYKFYVPFAKKIYPIVTDFYEKLLKNKHEFVILLCTWITLLIFPVIVLSIVWLR